MAEPGDRMRRNARAWSEHLPLLASLVVVLLAAVLRFYALDFQSLWNDELSSLARIQPGLFSEAFWGAIHRDVHPPGYLILLKGWVALFGTSDFSARSLSGVGGVLLVIAVMRVAWRLHDSSASLAAGLLAACAPFLIEYSQEVRGFSLAAWLTVEWVDVFLRATLPSTTLRSAPLRYAALGVVTAAAAYVHYMALLAVVSLLFCMALPVLLFRREAATGVLASFGFGALLYLPWWSGFAAHLQKGGLKWLREPKLQQVLDFDATLFPGFALLLLFLLAGVPKRAGAEPARFELAVSVGLFLWFVAMVLGAWIKSVHGAPIFNQRNLIVVLPVACVLLGSAVGARARWVQITVLVCTMAAVTCWNVSEREYYSRISKQQFREAAAQALVWDREQGGGVPVLSVAWSGRYFNHDFEQMGGTLQVAKTTPKSRKLKGWLAGLRRKDIQHVLVVYGHKKAREKDVTAGGHYQVAAVKRFKGAGVYLLRARSP